MSLVQDISARSPESLSEDKVLRELRKYEDYLVFEKGLRPLSVAAYCSDVRAFLEFLNIEGATSIEMLDHKDLERFISGGVVQGEAALYKETSLARRIASLRGYVRFLQQRGLVNEEWGLLLESPRLARTLPRCLTQVEMQHLLGVLRGETPRERRDRMIIHTLYALGLRVSELRDLRVRDLDIEAGIVRVSGKGGKLRLVPLLERLSDGLSEYLMTTHATFMKTNSSTQVDRGKGTSAGVSRQRGRSNLRRQEIILFPGPQGKKLSRVGLWKLIKKRLHQAGLSAEITPHTFRHTCATHLMQNGANLRLIQEILGHAHLQTTELYTHVMRNDLKRAAEKFHPFYN